MVFFLNHIRFLHRHHLAVHFFEAAITDAIDMVKFTDQDALKTILKQFEFYLIHNTQIHVYKTHKVKRIYTFKLNFS